MDQSTTRRSKPCWYKVVGLEAVNDSYLLSSILFALLQRRFSTHYGELCAIFHQCIFKTQLGQMMDMQSSKDRSLLTYDQWMTICVYKTAEYTFVLPIQLALFLAYSSTCNSNGVGTDQTTLLFEVAKLMGVMFQMQDDYLDVYGTDTGKAPTDIEEGKCAWPVVMALGMCNARQRARLLDIYGKPGSRVEVTQLFDALCLPQVYADKERDFVQAIEEKIEGIAMQSVRVLFEDLVQQLFRRVK